jgi:hypothetical protein
LPRPEPLSLGIKNNSYFDVDVYALPSLASTRVRLGTAGGFSTLALPVPPYAVSAGGYLMLYLHAIGTSRYWVTPELSVSSDMRACLQIYSDAWGDLSRSVFYSESLPDSTERRAGPTPCTTMTAVVDIGAIPGRAERR